jgi:6-phosphogluconolactonase
MNNIHILKDPIEIADYGAELFTSEAQAAIVSRNRFSVALSGGSTPQALYARLASPEFSERIPWKAVHLFWGDERCVPPGHADSNYHMAFESLLTRLPIPAGNIHRIQGELPSPDAAARYEGELRAFFGKEPDFDLVLLGLGDDGHTASLFPGSPALSESVRWVVDVEHTTPPLPLVSRVTLTFGVLNAARRVVFLVSGAGKAKILAQVLRGRLSLPAARIQPEHGELLWLVDQAAAGGLERESD